MINTLLRLRMLLALMLASLVKTRLNCAWYILRGLCQDWMSLFDRCVFPCDLEPAACIVQHRQVALTVVDVKRVFKRSLFHPRVLCKNKKSKQVSSLFFTNKQVK